MAETESYIPNVIEWTINPFRLIFWGCVVCVLGVDLTRHSWDGGEYTFDLLNNAVGMLLITFGLLRLGAIPLGGSYPSLIRFLQIVAVGNLILEIVKHFVFTFPTGITFILSLFELVTIMAVFLFCRAMCNLCKKAHLDKAARSWKTTTVLILALYVLPMGLLNLLSTFGIVFGDLVGFYFDSQVGFLLSFILKSIMAVAGVHFFISTSRMKKSAIAARAHRVSMGANNQEPAARPRISFQTLRSTFLGGVGGSIIFIAVVMFFAEGPGKVKYNPRKFSELFGRIEMDPVLAVEGTGSDYWDMDWSRDYFVEARYSIVNDECAFIVCPVLCNGISAMMDRGGSGVEEREYFHIGGSWKIGAQVLRYDCSIPSGDNTTGTMEIGKERFSLAAGQVFLISRHPDQSVGVAQFKVPMSADNPEEILRKLVVNRERARTLFVNALARELGGNQRRRRHAGFALYRYDFASGLPRELLVGELEKREEWPCLMAAKALWETEEDKQVIPALLDLLNRNQELEPGNDNSPSRIGQEQAARLLGQIGPEAQEAVPALREALNSENEGLALAAAQALKMINE